jgi:hypothetical protein
MWGGVHRLTEPLAQNETEVWAALESLEEEVASVIPRNKTYQPDDLREDKLDLMTAVFGENG